MAITWDVEISNVNVQAKRADVRAIRTDDENPNATETYSFGNTPIDTLDRTPLLNTIWAKHLEHVAKQGVVDTFVSNLEQLGKSNLEAREV